MQNTDDRRTVTATNITCGLTTVSKTQMPYHQMTQPKHQVCNHVLPPAEIIAKLQSKLRQYIAVLAQRLSDTNFSCSFLSQKPT